MNLHHRVMDHMDELRQEQGGAFGGSNSDLLEELGNYPQARRVFYAVIAACHELGPEAWLTGGAEKLLWTPIGSFARLPPDCSAQQTAWIYRVRRARHDSSQTELGKATAGIGLRSDRRGAVFAYGGGLRQQTAAP